MVVRNDLDSMISAGISEGVIARKRDRANERVKFMSER